MKRTAGLLTLGLLVHCSDPVDTADQVHDLRLLAMRVEPPEQSLASAQPVTVTALLADPFGAGRPVHCRWATCADLDSDTSRCLDGGPGYTLLAEADVSATAGGAEPSVTFSPDPVLL